MVRKLLFRQLGNQNGVTVVVVAFAMVALIGVAAIAVDLGYLYIVKGELQNAADSGALAGARVLYTDVEPVQVNPGANQAALDLVSANYSEKSPVTVQSIERGHWSFATKIFTPNDSLVLVSLWDVSTAELDVNTDFINAVRVVTTRKVVAGGLPAEPFFAKIFGIQGTPLAAVAVAYIGFAGTLLPGEVDQPVAICKQGILDGDEYTCGVGRMINSGSGNEGHQTGGWTNYTQPCETASASSVRPLVCASGNPDPITLGQGMGTTGGQLQTAFNTMYDCWKAKCDTSGDGIPDIPWPMTLPVIDCPGNNTGNCAEAVGAVELNLLWITQTDKTKFKEVPRIMLNPSTGLQWKCSTTETTEAAGRQCWSEFVAEFQLKDVLNGSDAFYEDKTMYFIPDCKPHIPRGKTGGKNFGILAAIPVLVK